MTSHPIRGRSWLGPVAALVSLCALAACGSGPNYGSKSLTNFTPKPESTPSPSPSAAAPPPTVAPVVAPPPTQKPVAAQTPRPTAPPQVLTQVITIQDASQAPNYYQPGNISVKSGTIIKFVNQDSVARIVKADNGAWSSPSIPPGGSWSYTTGATGNYPYHDQRPYAGGSITVT